MRSHPLGRVVRGGDTPAKMFSHQLHGGIFYIQLNYTFYVYRLMIFDKFNHPHPFSEDRECFLLPRKFPQYPSAASLLAPVPTLDSH